MEKPEYKKRYYLIIVIIAIFSIYCFGLGFIQTVKDVIQFLINIIR